MPFISGEQKPSAAAGSSLLAQKAYIHKVKEKTPRSVLTHSGQSIVLFSRNCPPSRADSSAESRSVQTVQTVNYNTVPYTNTAATPVNIRPMIPPATCFSALRGYGINLRLSQVPPSFLSLPPTSSFSVGETCDVTFTIRDPI